MKKIKTTVEQAYNEGQQAFANRAEYRGVYRSGSKCDQSWTKGYNDARRGNVQFMIIPA